MKRIEVSEQIVRIFEERKDELGYSNITSYMNDCALKSLGMHQANAYDLDSLIQQAIEPVLITHKEAEWLPDTNKLLMCWPLKILRQGDSGYKSLTYCVQLSSDSGVSIEQTIKFEGYTVKTVAKEFLQSIATHVDNFAYKEYTNDTFLYKRNRLDDYKDAYYGLSMSVIGHQLCRDINRTIDCLNQNITRSLHLR